MKINIKKLKLSNLNDVIEINKKNLPENYLYKHWLQMFNLGKNNSFVAFHNSIIIGYIMCDSNYIISFAIDEKYRGRGVGSLLLSNCLYSCENNIKLYCRHSNLALNLYKKHEFNIIEDIKDYYVNPIEDAFILEWNYKKMDLPKNKINID